ncbi:MAG: hypothetical protein ACJ8AW_50755 [Rhodopila sp.]|jgi:ABC-type phosphonate transport system ATPase subunit
MPRGNLLDMHQSSLIHRTDFMRRSWGMASAVPADFPRKERSLERAIGIILLIVEFWIKNHHFCTIAQQQKYLRNSP